MENDKNHAASKERRVYIRTETSVTMTLHLKCDGSTEEIEARTMNVSASGMMAEIGKDLPLASEVRIDLIPPGSANPVHCSGKIIWSTPLAESGRYQCGIIFTNIEEDNKNTFLKFLCDTIYKSSGKQS